MRLDQNETPLLTALQEFKKMRMVPFDVPGHKRGKGNPLLTDFLGEKCMTVDVNSMKCLDNLGHPISVIKEAEEMAADAFGAKAAFFMVNGTTSSVQAMILSVCKHSEKIIVPRNVHKSVINALILCGAIPVYVNPKTNDELGISLGMTVEEVHEAIVNNPEAKAVYINNPTYFGVCSDMKSITELAHRHNLKVLVDEAHGTHFYFGENLPISAMAAGADMAAVSMHKSGGSLTQSSILLCGPDINPHYVRQIINLTQSTSASYLLMSSLDISRKNLALHGKDIFEKVTGFAEYARDEINQIGDYYAFSKELINGNEIYDFDITKLSINTLNLGLAGVEVYDILRDEYDIQAEFGDVANMLAYISVGDRKSDIERLIGALSEIRRRFKKNKVALFKTEYINPEVIMTPRDAFYSESISLPLKECSNRICTEFVMCYPPGIPILAPGELITSQIIDYIGYCKDKGCSMTGPEDMAVEKLKVLKEV